jgi:carbonic anhydrase
MKYFENDYTPQEENTDVSPLNLTKFVKLIDYNRRFSYQGSLTTAPCAEGVLWNVVETVIPIRQSTLDEFTEFRRVAEEISTDYIIPETMKDTMDDFAQAKARHPDNCKCQYHDGNQFMRVAMCNRKVQDVNDRPVYHIDKKPEVED